MSQLLHALATALGWLGCTLAAALGLLALVSPRLFAVTAAYASRWVDSNRLLAVLDKRYDIDHCVLPYSRLLGALALAAALTLAWLCLW